MAETTLTAVNGETPVNPYSLLDAVNRSSDTAHTAWLIFIGIMAYLMIAVAGVTHRDLLLDKAVQLPILGVPIPQIQFFQFAPVFLLLFHLGLISQLVLLARKTLEFDNAVRQLEPTRKRSHPLRLELHNFFFVQGIAGPQRSVIMSLFLHSMSWLTLAILPVVLLLFIQISFLPYHNELITWTHRIALMLDIGVLVLIGVFLMRAETNFFQAFWRTSISHPLSFLITIAVLTFVALFSFVVATIPGEALDRTVRKYLQLDQKLHSAGVTDLAYLHGFTIPFLWGATDGTLFGFFHRNLIVTDMDLVIDKEVGRGERSLSLRGRDLRFAKLDRTDLHQADMTGANLDGASLVGADLSRVRLTCKDETELLFGDRRNKAHCASARGANFTGAKLNGAIMTGIDISRAKFENADLRGAVIKLGILVGTDMWNADLRKADLTAGIQAQGANFLVAKLEGADFNGGQLQLADFSNAQMQGASFNHAHLQGAVLRDGEFNGASLARARLHGADMAGTDLSGADMRGAFLWMTASPASDKFALADLSDVQLNPLGEIDLETLQNAIDSIDVPAVKKRVQEALTALLSSPESKTWSSSSAAAIWQAHLTLASPQNSPDYQNQLTDYLSGLACKTRWRDGSVAQGIVRRAIDPQFRGDALAVYDRLNRLQSCIAGAGVDPDLMQHLASAIDARAPLRHQTGSNPEQYENKF